MENRLGNVTEEFVGRGIVRICKSRSEYTTYRTGSGDAFSADDREVVDYENKGAGTGGGGQGHLFYGLYNQFMIDKDSLLYRHVPAWVDYSLMYYFRSAKLKGKTLQFKETMYETGSYRELRRKKIAPLTAKEITSVTLEALSKGERARKFYYAQIVRFLRFLEGAGKKHKLLKGSDFILNYMKETIVQAEDYLDKHPLESREDAETEAEEEAQAGSNQKYFAKRRADICKNINKRVCNWTEKEWADLEKAFVKSRK